MEREQLIAALRQAFKDYGEDRYVHFMSEAPDEMEVCLDDWFHLDRLADLVLRETQP